MNHAFLKHHIKFSNTIRYSLKLKTMNSKGGKEILGNEDFIQYVWKHGLFDKKNIFTTQGDTLEILSTGTINKDAGPDFFNASIKINGIKWAGNIEIHKHSSDWEKHGHSSDESYNSVILHVVLDNNQQITLPNGENLPTFIPTIDRRAWDNYSELIKATDWPACSIYLNEIDPIYFSSALNTALSERLQQKTEAIKHILAETRNDWSETFYRFLARGFGFNTNALPFELLAKSTPLKILAANKKNLFAIEAILFGQSGLLNEQLLGDDYFLALRDEYCYHAKKYGIKGIEGHLWKFLRLRPANFPTIRLAQFAKLICKSESLLSKITETKDVDAIKKFFDVGTSEYWDTHYKFNCESKKSNKRFGATACNTLIINSVAPFLFIYGDYTNNDDIKSKAIELLEALPAESNNTITRWQQLGFEAKNAFDTQALIQLRNAYCQQKKCLQCQLGNRYITKKQ